MPATGSSSSSARASSPTGGSGGGALAVPKSDLIKAAQRLVAAKCYEYVKESGTASDLTQVGGRARAPPPAP